MLDLAEHEAEGFIPLKVIAQQQEISEKYLESIIKLLVKAKLLNGLRGKDGGYQLTKASEQYTMGSILRMTEDQIHNSGAVRDQRQWFFSKRECR